MLEYEKFQEQQAKMMKMQEEYDRQISEMEEARQRSLGELTEYYETKIQEMTTKLEQVSFVCLICKDLTFITLWAYSTNDTLITFLLFFYRK